MITFYTHCHRVSEAGDFFYVYHSFYFLAFFEEKTVN
uniref:Uncharacterized protein n=1 Tax=Mammaliicoccus phage MSShimriz1 TaxID=3230127 RepID=A0AAU8GRY1_9VIRU